MLRLAIFVASAVLGAFKSFLISITANLHYHRFILVFVFRSKPSKNKNDKVQETCVAGQKLCAVFAFFFCLSI